MEAGISAVLECAPEDLQGRYALSLGASRCAEAVQPLCELLQRATSGGSGRVAAAALWGLYCLGDMRAFGCLVNSFPSLVGPSRRLCVKALSRIMASAAEVVLQGSADADDCDTAAEALAMASELLPRPGVPSAIGSGNVVRPGLAGATDRSVRHVTIGILAIQCAGPGHGKACASVAGGLGATGMTSRAIKMTLTLPSGAKKYTRYAYRRDGNTSGTSCGQRRHWPPTVMSQYLYFRTGCRSGQCAGRLTPAATGRSTVTTPRTARRAWSTSTGRRRRGTGRRWRAGRRRSMSREPDRH